MKKFIALILTALLACSLVACGDKSKETQPTESSVVTNEKAVDTTEKSDDTSKDKENDSKDIEVVKSFVDAIKAKNYDAIIQCLNIDADKSFVSAEDIEFALPRSSFADLADDSIKDSTADFSSSYQTGDDHTTVTVVCKKDDKEVANTEIKTILNDKNEWKIDTNDFYYQNYSFRTPGNVEVSVNGKTVDKEFISKSKTGGLGTSCDWTLPYVGKKEAKIKLTCANYTFETSLTTTENNTLADKGEDTYKVFYDIEADEQEKIFKSIKDTWNAMYKDWLAGKNANDLLNGYLSDDADPDIATRIIDGFKSMSDQGSNGNDKFNMVTVQARPDGSVQYITDELIGVNFGYKLSWHYKLADWNQDMTRFSSIILKKTDKGYKIYKLIDEGLFTECNNFTKDW